MNYLVSARFLASVVCVACIIDLFSCTESSAQRQRDAPTIHHAFKYKYWRWAPSGTRLLPSNSRKPPQNARVPPSGTRYGPTAPGDPTINGRSDNPTGPAVAGPYDSLFDATIARASDFRKFLSANRIDDMVCRAIGSLFDTNPPANACAGRITNTKATVAYQVTVTDAAAKIYEVELLGKSTELALSEANWVERHRFYVSFGFNSLLEPYVTVFDFEPMFRTTPNLFPVRDDLFEYIKRDRDSLLRAFQERVKSSISTTFLAEFDKQLVGAK